MGQHACCCCWEKTRRPLCQISHDFPLIFLVCVHCLFMIPSNPTAVRCSSSRLCLCLVGARRVLLPSLPLLLIYLWIWGSVALKWSLETKWKRGKQGQNAACRPVRVLRSPPWDYHHNNTNQNTRRRSEADFTVIFNAYLIESATVERVELREWWCRRSALNPHSSSWNPK